MEKCLSFITDKELRRNIYRMCSKHKIDWNIPANRGLLGLLNFLLLCFFSLCYFPEKEIKSIRDRLLCILVKDIIFIENKLYSLFIQESCLLQIHFHFIVLSFQCYKKNFFIDKYFVRRKKYFLKFNFNLSYNHFNFNFAVQE